MSFLSGHANLPKGPAGPDLIWTYIFKHAFYHVNEQKENYEKKNLKKKKKIDFFFDFLKVRRPGRKISDFRTVLILKIWRTSGPDVMSGRALGL